MTKVNISAELERRLKSTLEFLIEHNQGTLTGVIADVQELLAKIEKSKAIKESRVTREGVSWSQLLAWFYAELGPALAVPPNPSAGWIVRQLARAREVGLSEREVKIIAGNLRRNYPISGKYPNYDIEWVLRNSIRLLGSPYDSGAGISDAECCKVHTGRASG